MFVDEASSIFQKPAKLDNFSCGLNDNFASIKRYPVLTYMKL